MRTILCAAMSTALMLATIFASPATAAATTWNVQVGALTFDSPGPPTGLPNGSANRFYPGSIAINQGDTIQFNAVGPHTVTFNRPPGPIFVLFASPNITPSPVVLTSASQRVNSGIIGFAPGAYKVRFDVPAGRYQFICGLHIGMTETIDVLPAGQTPPKTPDEVGAIAQRQIARDLAKIAEIAEEAREDENDEDNDGAAVLVGAGNRRVSNLRFFPATVTVHVGQSVTFLKTKDPTEPHTVTFGTEPADPFAPSGGNTFDGTGGVNSGLMVTSAQFDFFQLAGTPYPNNLLRFRVKFTKAGTFNYICAIHDEIGMVGRVRVVP